MGKMKEPVSARPENNERGTWSRQIDFFLSCVGYVIGVGNLWRFPYFCMKNGGGAFLIPYFIFLFLCAMPLYFLEVSVGQFSSLSPITVWKMSPMFKGIGYGTCILAGVTCIYYNVILAWSLYYFANSFTMGTLPWVTCDNWWNTPSCTERMRHDLDSPAIQGNTSMTNVNYTSESMSGVETAEVVNLTSAPYQPSTPAEEFWHYKALQLSEGIEWPGSVRWSLVGCLALSWIAIFLCLFKGVHSLGKVVYVTATVPFVMLLALLIRGVTLPGAAIGLRYYLYPDFAQLAKYEVWCEACAQIFYSLGMAYGVLITMASYNNFNHNCYKISIAVPLINALTSFFAGFVTFSVLGFMSLRSGVPVSQVITSGPGLAFVVYPEALAMLPGSAIWSALFFLMLFMLGLDTQFGMFETMIMGLVDSMPRLRAHRTHVTAIACFIMFLLGLPIVTQGGIYVFQIFDWYSAIFSPVFIGLFEFIVVSWVYGLDRIYGDLELMLGRRLCSWWGICWKYVSPAALTTIVLFAIIMFTTPSYGSYTYPWWAILLGWCLALCSVLPIPAVAIYKLVRARGSLKQRLAHVIKPADDWGPSRAENRKGTIYASTAEVVVPLNSQSV